MTRTMQNRSSSGESPPSGSALGEVVHMNAQLLGCALADIGVDFGHQLVERLVDVVHLTESLEIVRAVCRRIAADGRHGVVEVLPLLVGVVQRITAFQGQLVEIAQTENGRAQLFRLVLSGSPMISSR